MRKLLLIVLMIFLVIPFSFALTSYNQTGTVNAQYNTDSGVLGRAESTATFNQKAVGFTDITAHPYVADLDGDGINEIIIIDSNVIEIKDLDLNPVDSFTLEGNEFSNLVLANIDEDVFVEIMVANEDFDGGNLSILEFNGTVFKRQTLLDFPIGVNFPAVEGVDSVIDVMLACGDRQAGNEPVTCIYVRTHDNGITDEFLNISVAAFNSSNRGDFTPLFGSFDSTSQLCAPQVPSIAFADYESSSSPFSDTRKEFIISNTIFTRISVDDRLILNYVDAFPDLTVIPELQIQFSSGGSVVYDPIASQFDTCDNDDPSIRGYFTSPLVADFDGSPSNGLETIVGLKINSGDDDFVMVAFDADGNFIDNFPSTFRAEGEILSNPMKATIFGDTPADLQFCVTGHSPDAGTLDLLCATLQGNGFKFSPILPAADSIEFLFNTNSEGFNISQDHNQQNIMSHMTQYSNAKVTLDGNTETDPDELVTTYGIFQISNTDFNSSSVLKSMTKHFAPKFGDSVCIPVDAQRTRDTSITGQGGEDLVCKTATSISFTDDGISNGFGVIGDVSFDPCVINTVLRVNTTLEILVTVDDEQNEDILGLDPVSSIVTIYEGTTFEQISSVINTTSGLAALHPFVVNVTGSNFKIKIVGFDAINEDTTDTQTQFFSVGLSGLELGDSECTIDFNPDPDEVIAEGEIGAVCTSDADCNIDAFCNSQSVCQDEKEEDTQDNALLTGLRTFRTFGLGTTTVWLFVMLAFSLGIWLRAAMMNWSGNSAFGAIAISNVLFIIIGARIGVLSVALVVTLVVSFLVILGVFAGRFLTGAGTNNG